MFLLFISASLIICQSLFLWGAIGAPPSCQSGGACSALDGKQSLGWWSGYPYFLLEKEILLAVGGSEEAEPRRR